MTVILAWVNGEDIRVERQDDGTEWLVVDGVPVLLPEVANSPVQQIINYCHANKRYRRAMRTAWTRTNWEKSE